MITDDMDQLKQVLDNLAKIYQSTINRLWGPGDWARPQQALFPDGFIGLQDHAKRYRARLISKDNKVQPFELEARLVNLVSKAMEFKKLILQGKDDGILGELTRTAHLLDLKGSSAHSFLSPFDSIKFWFPSSCDYSEDTEQVESPEDDSEEWGYGLAALDDLAGLATEARKQAAQRKKAANGTREDYQSPMNGLLREIGIDVLLSKSPTSHVVPIARAIHIWASGEKKPAQNWGITPWRAVHNQLKEEPEQFWNNLKKKP